MKLILFFLLIPLSSICQEPPKGSNTIVVKGITFAQVISSLLDSGYSIQAKDTLDKTVITEFKGERKTGMNYRIRIRVKDSVAYITGQYKLGLSIRAGLIATDPNELTECEYRGWRTGAYRIIFAKLDQFARSLTGSITYAKL